MQLTADNIWSQAQESLRALLNPELYQLWFAPLRAAGMDAETFTLEVSNDFCEVWLKDNYLGLLRDVVATATGKQLEVCFRVAAHVAGPAASSAKAKPVDSVPSGAASRPPQNHVPADAELGFNPRNTFDTFVVGNNNFAHAAALAVAQAPGKSYNPLFLYGGVGLGKTHLLHAVGHHVSAHKKNARIAYVTTEKFTNEFIAGLQENQLARFRKKYRQTDLLLIDDVQFLAGKERIQEEFFHTFNALHEAHKQIILTCDRPPSEIQGLEQRLGSRFEWGLVTDLQPPDVETRLAILQKKARSMGCTLPDDIAEFLANHIRTNIRRLEGALIRVVSYASLTGKPLGLDLVENLLRDVLHEEGRHTLTIEVIQKRVAEHFDIRLADMTSKRRPENIAFPRQIAMYLSRQMTEGSLNTIGEAFGGRDHGTVMHACRLVKDRMEVDTGVRQTVMMLEKKLRR
jgi:chromosomal replication initiator protein